MGGITFARSLVLWGSPFAVTSHTSRLWVLLSGTTCCTEKDDKLLANVKRLVALESRLLQLFQHMETAWFKASRFVLPGNSLKGS